MMICLTEAREDSVAVKGYRKSAHINIALDKYKSNASCGNEINAICKPNVMTALCINLYLQLVWKMCWIRVDAKC